MNIAEKVRIAEQLEKLNVDIIEAGFLFLQKETSRRSRPFLKTITRSEVAALARANLKDIDRAWEAVKGARFPRLHAFISTSDIHLKHQLKKSKEEVIRIAARSVARAKQYTAEC